MHRPKSEDPHRPGYFLTTGGNAPEASGAAERKSCLSYLRREWSTVDDISVYPAPRRVGRGERSQEGEAANVIVHVFLLYGVMGT